MKQILFFLLTLLWLWTPEAWARPGGSKLAAAQGEFNRGNFEEALKLLGAAEAEATGDDTLARIKLLQGQAYGAQRDFAQAERRFAAALAHDPEVELDPNKVDPDLVKLLNGVRERLRGELKVRADQPGAKAYLDGKALGTIPVRAPVSIGRHRLEVRSVDGRYGATRQVVVRSGRPVDVDLKLSPLPRSAPPLGKSAEGAGGAPVMLGFGKPFADLRMGLAPIQISEGVAFEVGGGLESQYLRVAGHLQVFPAFGIVPRGAFTVPVVDAFRGYVSLELPILFLPQASLAIGGSGGAEYMVGKWLSLFAEVGARHFFFAPTSYAGDRLVLQAGTRLRLP